VRVLLVIILFYIPEAFSANWIKNTEIDEIRWYGEIGYVTLPSSQDLEGCGKSLPYVKFDNSMDGHKEYLSLLMSAFYASKKIDIMIDGCIGEYAKLAGVIVKK